MPEVSAFSQRVENAKKIIEIFAILSAGIWVIFNFILKDTVSLNASIIQTNEMQTNDWSTESLYSVNYNLQIKNIGNYPFYIDTVKIYYWVVFDSVLDSSEYYNYYKICKETSATDSIILTGNETPLTSGYDHDQNHKNDFTFAFRNIKGKSIVFFSYSIGHYFDYLHRKINCHSSSNTWMYDCWNRTLEYRNSFKKH